MSNSYVERAVASLGGATGVAQLRKAEGLRGGTPWAISKWIKDGVPPNNVLWLSERTGWIFTPHQLAPHLYPHPEDGLPPRHRVSAEPEERMQQHVAHASRTRQMS